MRYSPILLVIGLTLLSVGCEASVSTPAPENTAVPSPFTLTPTPLTMGASAITSPLAATLTAPPITTSTTQLTRLPAPDPETPTLTPTAAPPAVTFSADGRHAFPVAGDLALMTWTHFHWDGSNAVDIDAARHLAGDSDQFKTFIQLPVVAVVSGTVTIADNYYGGLALLLYGEDGFTYYYGHLSEQWVNDGQVVQVGDWIGRIGNTGHNTQYIEPHLHFSIATHTADDWRWEPDVNAAEQFLTWFDLPWQDPDIPEYAIDHAAGWPLVIPAEITRPFTEPHAQNPDQGSIDIVPTTLSEEPIPVYATLEGEVTVERATVMGLRAQITNRPARTTVVYSFLSTAVVTDGDVVKRGDLVGYIDPVIGLNYMLFVRDVPTDPTPTLGDPP